MNEEKSSEKNPGLQQGKLLFGSGVVAVATLLGYILTHRYEVGYAAKFGISEQAVDVTLPAVLTCIGAIIFLFYFLGATVHWILTRAFIRRHWVGFSLMARLTGSSFILFIFCALITHQAQRLFPYLFLISLIGLGIKEIWIPIHKQIGVKGWLHKIGAYRKEVTEKAQESKAMDVFEKLFGLEMVLIFVFGATLCWPAPMVGSIKAATQRDFAVATIDGKSYALIRRYDDRHLFELLSRNEQESILCSKVLTMTSSELAAQRITMQNFSIDPPRMVADCE